MRLTYLRFVLPATLAMAALLVWPLLAWWDADVADAVIASGIIALANTLIAGISFDMAIDKSNQVFLITVFGGMGVRMVITMAAFFVLLSQGFNGRALAFALLAFYIAYLVLEIMFTTRELSRRRVRVPRKTPAPKSPHLQRASSSTVRSSR